MLVAFVANTRMDSSEFHVEYDPPHTIELIKTGIQQAGYQFAFIEADERVVDTLQTVRPDLVLNRAEGIWGESRESHIPAILEMLGIPYIGSNILTTATCLNKAWTKKILSYHRIATPQFQTYRTMDQFHEIQADFTFPVILKPNDEGSSMGIDLDNVVHTIEELERKLESMLHKYDQEILVEDFIGGREFSVGVLQKEGDWQIFPVLEIDFSRLPQEIGQVFGQYAKTLDAESEYVRIPAEIDQELLEEIEKTTIQILKVLQVVDFARIDFRLNQEGKLYFLEINPLPGMDYDLPDDFSFYPLMAHHAGLSYSALVKGLIDSAKWRYQLP